MNSPAWELLFTAQPCAQGHAWMTVSSSYCDLGGNRDNSAMQASQLQPVSIAKRFIFQLQLQLQQTARLPDSAGIKKAVAGR
jgi:hypothetical protein